MSPLECIAAIGRQEKSTRKVSKMTESVLLAMSDGPVTIDIEHGRHGESKVLELTKVNDDGLVSRDLCNVRYGSIRF